MFNACVARFDVMGNLKKKMGSFWKLNETMLDELAMAKLNKLEGSIQTCIYIYMKF